MILILDPAITMSLIAMVLNELGWQRVREVEADPVEPMAAQWVFPASGARLTYTFHPATHLRTLQPHADVTDTQLAAISAQLRIMSVADAARLLTYPAIESILLGLQIARLQPDPRLLEPVAALLTHPDLLVAETARQAYIPIAGTLFAEALPVLAARYADKPQEALVFTLLGDPLVKRQVLRWMGRVETGKRNPAAITATLREALQDSDWETRLTAMLMSVRLGASSLADDIQSLALPADTRDGLDSDDRRLLMALQDISAALLRGAPIPPDTSEVPITRETMWQHLTRCVAGETVAWYGRGFLLVYALTTPLALPDERPSTLPDGLILFDRWAWLGDINVMWVAPVIHWLGDELPKNGLPNPIRRYSPSQGFFIAQSPTEALYTWEEAQVFCSALGKRYGATVHVPTADEWEMAVRGPDGRRFPWGNAYQPDGRDQSSPWGLYSPVGVVPQWVTGAGGEPLICGGKDQLRCSVRKKATSTTRAAVRLVVSLTEA